MSWISVAIGGGEAALGFLTGAHQKNMAHKALDTLNATRPIETTPQEYIQNQELATSRANTGIPSEQYAMAMKNIQRQQLMSLKSASDRKGGLGLLASLDANGDSAIGKLDSANATARLNNQKDLIKVNNQLGTYKVGQFNRNVRQPWNRDYEYNMGLLGSGNQNQANSLNSLGLLAATGLKGQGFGSGTTGRTAAGGNALNEEYNYEHTRGFNP